MGNKNFCDVWTTNDNNNKTKEDEYEDNINLSSKNIYKIGKLIIKKIK
jgi:hypothetical protein